MPIIRDVALRTAKIAASCAVLAAVVLAPHPAWAEDAPGDDKPPPNRFAISLGAGLAGYKLYGVSIGGGALEAVLGGNIRHVTLGADIEGFSGSTQYGLSTNMFTVGMLVEGDFDRFRLGGGFRLGSFNVDRATTTGSLGAGLFGLFMRMTFDIVRFDDDRDAVFLAFKFNTDTVGGGLYGLTLGAGVRF
jgi:hypothetical protein